jgi:hypothetical protein
MIDKSLLHWECIAMARKFGTVSQSYLDSSKTFFGTPVLSSDQFHLMLSSYCIFYYSFSSFSCLYVHLIVALPKEGMNE